MTCPEECLAIWNYNMAREFRFSLLCY